MSSAFLAVDSWAVRDGRARGLARHRDRFVAACSAAGLDPALARGFFDDVVESLPRTGEHWPRVELNSDGTLSHRLRPLPAPTGPLTVSVHQGDPRRFPRRKGPDLELLDRIRSDGDADEVLLTDAAGILLEGTTTSLVWWQDNTLCTPPTELGYLAGVTTALLQERADVLGVPRDCPPSGPEQLAGREVWLVNAVHGIRTVAAWSNGMAAGPPGRTDEWRQWLEDQLEPLP